MRLKCILFSFVLSLIVPFGLIAQQSKMDTLSYVSPHKVNIDSVKLYSGIDSIITEALDSGAFPGCQILLAKAGQVFYYESFGFHTYDSVQKVRNLDLYDLASITKITASTLALMKLYEEGQFDLHQTMGYYFPFLAKSNKDDLSIRKVLAHQSRMKNWIPYYSESQRRNGKYKRKTISADSSETFPYRIPGSDLFLHKNFREDKIFKMIKKSDLYNEEGYVYSGLAFYLFPDLIERLSGVPFEQYLANNFYKPLEANSLGFDPLKKYNLSQIVPSEIDTFFRMSKLHGVVHDEGAAVMLGISGNAGLFSNAGDLAKVYQMLLNGGTYNGNQYLKPETIKEFTRCQYCEKDNRRGLGFDKPLIEYDSIKSSVAKLASANSYGHSGYTGTLVWADPDNQLLFVFLANRVYPSRTNRKIYQLNIRPRIHDLVYGLLEEEKE
ncbi:serine hydrolase domain-containing protein [Reichenbachiella sp.]|uniref:serine hydrolase domain-containing protein n=1 Tax=Reichenbachiella sp. TaxID=2184521 RepID=UPI003BAEAD65